MESLKPARRRPSNFKQDMLIATLTLTQAGYAFLQPGLKGRFSLYVTFVYSSNESVSSLAVELSGLQAVCDLKERLSPAPPHVAPSAAAVCRHFPVSVSCNDMNRQVLTFTRTRCLISHIRIR